MMKMKRLMAALAAFLLPVAGAQEDGGLAQVSLQEISATCYDQGKQYSYGVCLRVRPTRLGDYVVRVRDLGTQLTDAKGKRLESVGRESISYGGRADDAEEAYMSGSLLLLQGEGAALSGNSLRVKGTIEAVVARNPVVHEPVAIEVKKEGHFQVDGIDFELRYQRGDGGYVALTPDQPERVASVTWISRGQRLAPRGGWVGVDAEQLDLSDVSVEVSTWGEMEVVKIPLSFRVGICGVVASRKKEDRK